jgi:hypothetical protein
METDIDPEPSPEERDALLEALREVAAETPNPYSAWWRRGVREAVTPSEERV